MKNPNPPSCLKILIAATFLLGASELTAQTNSEEQADQVFELSPFEVSTSSDKGYYAANSISGSRIDVQIQDIPLTIEVITSEFIEDTGSSDLRDSLRYSAGVLLETQNDAYGGFEGFGQVNNPEGATANKSQSTVKIRGFVTNNTLRNGFRRQHATDTINIDRIEVIRGPSALLYGVGNFGGVVNYLTKAPLPYYQTIFNVGIGSNGWRRTSLDVTGPLPGGFSFRLTGAFEGRDDHTQLNSHEHWFISPVLEWKWKKTKITVDFEAGEADDDGIGFRSVRAPTLEDVPIFQSDRLETYGFLEFEGEDPKSFRWSGPDTFLDTVSRNINVALQQGITEHLNLMVGYNYSSVEFTSVDVFGGVATNSSAKRAQPYLDTIQAIQIIDGKNSDVIIDVEDAVLQYNWSGSYEDIGWDQIRAELNYGNRFFEGNRWLESEHSLLIGASYEEQDRVGVGLQTNDSPDGDNFMYKNPTDSSPILFSVQADGTPSLPFRAYDVSGGVSENEGKYLVYSGRYFNDRLFLVAGMREDTTSSKDGFYGVIGSRGGITTYEDSEVSKQTSQFGASIEIIEGLTLYALQSEGVEPNFGGERDGLGKAIDSSVAEAKEAGVKINLFGGKIAATASIFKIQRDGLPFSYWWAPAPARGQFRPGDNIIYRTDTWSAGNKLNDENRYLAAAISEWQTAVDTGAVYQKETEDGRAVYTYLNASTPEGAAFLDRVFAELQAEFNLPRDQRTDNDPWPGGFLYEGLDDPEVNTASEDWASGDFYQSISDQSEGWEAQLIWSPNDNFQLVLNYSHVERTVTDPGGFVKFPYVDGNEDRWASWYFPNTNWGLGGVNPEVVYPGGENGQANTDTSSWSGVGWGKGESLDDTPDHVVSWWATYRFNDGFMNGWHFSFGGNWTSEREYASSFTTAGQRKQNETGTKIQAVSEARLILSGMAKYSWRIDDQMDAFIQLNVDNLLDDTDQYGFIYAPGRSWKIVGGVSF